MIYDPHSSALYADDGTFLHTVYCPMALTPDQLDALYPDSADRHCHQGNRISRPPRFVLGPGSTA